MSKLNGTYSLEKAFSRESMATQPDPSKNELHYSYFDELAFGPIEFIETTAFEWIHMAFGDNVTKRK